MATEIRHAYRALKARPALVCTAIATFAVGIGATTAMYSVVDGVLLRPLPYPEPDRIVRVWEEHPGSPIGRQRQWMSNVTLDAWAGSAATVAAFGRYSSGTDTVGIEQPERIPSATVSASLFEVLRTRPALGRLIVSDDEPEGAPPVVVLSHGFWRSRFGGQATALGQSLVINGQPHEIVGVTPAGFGFPAPTTAFWRPSVVPLPGAPGQQFRVQATIARVVEGVEPSAVAAEGTATARSQTRPMSAQLLLGTGGPVEVHARPLAEDLTASVRPALLVSSAAVAVVLLLACANVTNLFLSRGVSRQREMAVRSALGASRLDLSRQALVEGLVLATAGGMIGVALATGLLRMLPVVAPAGFPRLDDITIDWPVLALSLGVTLASGLLAALAPAWRASRVRVTALNDGGRASTGGAGTRRLRRGLLVAEAALAVMLLVGSALLGRSLWQLLDVDGGYDTAGVLTADVLFPAAARGPADVMPRVDEILSAVRALPGVVAAGGSNMAPFSPVTALQSFGLREVGPDGQPLTARAVSWQVTPGFMEALGLRVKSGRLLQAGDVGAPTQAFLVNEEFVRQYWNDGQTVLGRQYPGLINQTGVVAEVVGVVGNVLKDGLDREAQPEIFVPAGTAGRTLSGQIVLAIRTEGHVADLVPAVRHIVNRVDPRIALDKVAALNTKVSASVATPRFAAALLAGFAGIALLLAAIGLYGMLSYGVSERRREIGVRAALGASRGRIVGLVLGEGLLVVLAGVVVGLTAAGALARLLSATLFGITPLDPWSYLAAPAVLLAVALTACIWPARRAAAVDPVDVLRAE